MKARFLNNIIKVKNNSKLGRIIILTGARQTGKTTLAKNSFPEYKYISIEDPILRSEYVKLTSKQWQESYPNAILDEVQKEPILIESIKAVYDQFQNTKYILLGSSQILLLQKVKESLAGRCSIYEVFPLTLPEIATSSWDVEPELSFFQSFIKTFDIPSFLPSFTLYDKYSDSIKIFEEYLKFGGYPAIIDDEISDNDKREWLYNYIRTYLERDIRDLVEIKNLEPFIKIQKTTSMLTGCILNFSQLAKEANVSSNTAQRFLNYLELSYQTILIKPWHKNNLKRLNKTAKLHYLDPGIQRTILKKQGQLTGNEFESAIVAEIYKQIKCINIETELYHLRTFDGREIDLLIEMENGYIAIEIKMTSNANIYDAKHIKGLEDILDKPLLHSFIISNDMSIKTFLPKITALPAAMFLT